MLHPKHWPAPLAEMVHAVVVAGRPLQAQQVRIDVYDETYEVSVRIPRVLVDATRPKQGA